MACPGRSVRTKSAGPSRRSSRLRNSPSVPLARPPPECGFTTTSGEPRPMSSGEYSAARQITTSHHDLGADPADALEHRPAGGAAVRGGHAPVVDECTTHRL